MVITTVSDDSLNSLIKFYEGRMQHDSETMATLFALRELRQIRAAALKSKDGVMITEGMPMWRVSGGEVYMCTATTWAQGWCEQFDPVECYAWKENAEASR